MKSERNKLIRQFEKVIRKAQPNGYILQGSVMKRHLTRQGPTGVKQYGPYYLWTRKLSGKTVTVALDKQQAVLIQDAIRRGRAFHHRLDQLHALSEKIIRSVSPGVPRRSRQTKDAK